MKNKLSNAELTELILRRGRDKLIPLIDDLAALLDQKDPPGGIGDVHAILQKHGLEQTEPERTAEDDAELGQLVWLLTSRSVSGQITWDKHLLGKEFYAGSNPTSAEDHVYHGRRLPSLLEALRFALGKDAL